jgi:CheY-like chemotaxis protein
MLIPKMGNLSERLPEPNPLHEKLVLIVDDNLKLSILLGDWLGLIFPHHRFTHVGSGEEALEWIGQHLPVLVLMDLALPGMSGIAALHKIKESYPDIPVLLLTLNEDNLYREKAAHAGAAGFVTKRAMHLELVPVLKELLLEYPG